MAFSCLAIDAEHRLDNPDGRRTRPASDKVMKNYFFT
ncbi:MAG: hypothetical protein ACJARL_001083 [Halopseudomonas sp.]|jgi:hypothetical protein